MQLDSVQHGGFNAELLNGQLDTALHPAHMSQPHEPFDTSGNT